MPDFWISISLLGLTICYGFLNYKKIYPVYIRPFIFLLLGIFVLQFIAYYYSHNSNRSNHFIINLYFLFEISFVLLIYNYAAATKKNKTLAKILLICFLPFALWNISYGQGFYTFNSMSISLGIICIIIFSIVYLSTLFLSDTPVNFFSIPMFWMVTGWLFYFTGVIVYFSALGYIVKYNLDPQGNVYAIIMLTLECILYTLVLVGFYTACKWKKEKSYLQ